MSTYHTEGFIKMVSKGKDGVVFTIEATAPYLFESKCDSKESTVKRKVLLVCENEETALIKDECVRFLSTSIDLTSLLIAKANHLKVLITIEDVSLLSVSTLNVF